MTRALILGALGFVLFLIYDINSVTAQKRVLNICFALGCVLVCAAAGLLLRDAARSANGAVSTVLLVLGALSALMLVYCLFFALPFSDTYINPEKRRRVYSGGAYALCRHPGVLCFFFAFLFWGLAAPGTPLLPAGLIFSLMDLLYAVFQDRFSFPKTFVDYEDYRERVPFLIPTRESIRMAVKTWPQPARKKDAK